MEELKMSLQTEWIRYGDNGEYSGYVARLSEVREPQPSVIVLQEIWGVDEHIQDITRRIAQAGYVAFAPDLFAIDGERPGPLAQALIDDAKKFLNSLPQAHWRDPEKRELALSRYSEHKQKSIADTLELIFNLSGQLEQFVRQVFSTSAWLRNTYEYSYGKGVASIGFCLGGGLSGMLAAQEPELRGAVIFYGSQPPEDIIPNIRCPIAGFYGGLDKRITDQVPAFAEKLKAAGKSFEYQIYEGAQHAFFNDTRPSYHIKASRDAFVRTLAFLQKVLED
jgi:carboxymethylenebutenolidase